MHPSEPLSSLFLQQSQRPDLLAEMDGLDWTLAVVDLRRLVAFQRRIAFDPDTVQTSPPNAEDWSALFATTFGPPISLDYTTRTFHDTGFVLETTNPNLRLRPASSDPGRPLQLHGGSPFFEVARYRGRWFLRDGYHRAHALLRANIVHVPAVVIHARTLAELGPIDPWFFPQQVLFDSHPPLVIDFLDHELTIEYTRPRMLKTLRITVEESFAPIPDEPIKGVTQ